MSYQLRYKPAVAIKRLAAADPKLADLMATVGPFRLGTEFGVSPFQVLLRAIIYQQLSGRAAEAIYKRFLALFEDPDNTTADELIKLTAVQLRSAGLSHAKIRAVHDLASKSRDAVVPPLAELTDLSDQEIINRLTSVRGVGQWTVEIMLIFRLGRPDVLPAADLGIRKGYQKIYGGEELPTPKQLRIVGERWAPYRSVASWYLWRATDSLPLKK